MTDSKTGFPYVKDLNYKSEMIDNTVYAAFDSIQWDNSTIKARDAIIRNTSKSIVVCQIDFGKEYESVNGMFRIKFPERLIEI